MNNLCMCHFNSLLWKRCHSLDRPSDLITIDRVIDEDELVEFLGKPVPGPPNLKKLLEGQEMELFGALTYAWIKIGCGMNYRSGQQ